MVLLSWLTVAGQPSKTRVIVEELEYDLRASRMWFGDGMSKGVISFLPLASRPKSHLTMNSDTTVKRYSAERLSVSMTERLLKGAKRRR